MTIRLTGRSIEKNKRVYLAILLMRLGFLFGFAFMFPEVLCKI